MAGRIAGRRPRRRGEFAALRGSLGGARPQRGVWDANERDGYLVFRRRMESLYDEREAERMADPRMTDLRAFWRSAP